MLSREQQEGILNTADMFVDLWEFLKSSGLFDFSDETSGISSFMGLTKKADRIFGLKDKTLILIDLLDASYALFVNQTFTDFTEISDQLGFSGVLTAELYESLINADPILLSGRQLHDLREYIDIDSALTDVSEISVSYTFDFQFYDAELEMFTYCVVQTGDVIETDNARLDSSGLKGVA